MLFKADGILFKGSKIFLQCLKVISPLKEPIYWEDEKGCVRKIDMSARAVGYSSCAALDNLMKR